MFFSFGRRITILIFMITLTFSSLGAAFSPNMETFIVIRLAIAASAVAVWTTGFVYSKIFFPLSLLFFLFFPYFPLFLFFSIVIRLAIAASAVAVWTTGFVYSKTLFSFSSLLFPHFSLFPFSSIPT